MFELADYQFERRGYVGIGSSLREVNPDTLQPLTRRGLRLGGYATRPVFSPQRREAAFGLNLGELVFVDLGRMQRRARMQVVGPEWAVEPIGWPRTDLLVAIGCLEAGKYGCSRSRLILVDPLRRRTRASIELPGLGSGAFHRRSGRSAVLVGTGRSLAGAALWPARLLVVEPNGVVREVLLRRLVVGTDARSALGRRYRSAGFALDRGRAIVVGPDGLVAEVSLRTLRLRYHRVEGLGLPRRALMRAPATPWTGTLNPHAWHERSVTAFWPGVVAVTGSDSVIVRRGRTTLVRSVTLEKRLLETRSWSARRAPETRRGMRVGDLVLASTGGVDETRKRFRGPFGLVAYERSGAVRFRLRFRSAFTWSVFGDRLYVGGIDGRTTRIFDSRTGRFLRRVRPTDVEPEFRWTLRD